MTQSKASLCALLVAMGVGVASAKAAPLPADGRPESPVPTATSDGEAAFVASVHDHVHHRWTDNFLRLVGEKLPVSDPLNAPGLAAEVDLAIGPDGQLVSMQTTRSSGFQGFDSAVGDVLHDAVPFPKPPQEVQSDDGNAHLHWLFARDQRRCSGVGVVHLYDPIAIVLPKLLAAGRRDEALRRIAMARQSGLPAAAEFDAWALSWSKVAVRDPHAPLALVKAMAVRGDADALAVLKQAARRPEVAADAGAALVALKVAVCPLVKDALESADPAAQEAAAQALSSAADPACAGGLVKLLQNRAAKPEARTAAATALGGIDDDAAKKALSESAKGDKPIVQAAAMLAGVRPGSGRIKVIAMERTLRDPSPELRAASAAGVVRAGGDTNLADLYVLFKDSDPRPALAALRELERLRTDESTKLIARLAHRPQLDVERAAADILIRRGERDSWSALKAYLDPSADVSMRGRALALADDTTLRGLVGDPALGLWAYRARLLRGERDKAIDCIIAAAPKTTVSTFGLAMADWLAHMPAPAAKPAPPTTTAAKTTP
jgi:HEAT repeat protein